MLLGLIKQNAQASGASHTAGNHRKVTDEDIREISGGVAGQSTARSFEVWPWLVALLFIVEQG